MAPRAYWKGSLKLSLVSCPVALYPATTSVEKTHFHGHWRLWVPARAEPVIGRRFAPTRWLGRDHVDLVPEF
jgi:hypothetical protein